MSIQIKVDYAQPIPLFPLPGCVLLPSATIPLHIFEPRYRQMLTDALESSKLIAMATFEGEEWKQDYEGSPPLRSHVCVGYIARHQLLDDGRYNLLLHGLQRARIVEEVPHEPYRLALLAPTESRQPMEIDLSEERQQIEDLLNDSQLRELTAVSAVRNWISQAIPTVSLVDLAIMTLCDNIEQRYDMLMETDAAARAQWLIEYLRQTRRTIQIAERFRPAEQPDGVYLN